MPFDPTLARGVLAVHDPDAYGLADNAAIATAVDSSSNGNDATQGTSGRRPVYKTAIIGSHAAERYDGEPARVGAGTVQTLHTPEIFSSSMPEFTMYFVVKALAPVSPFDHGFLYVNYGNPDDEVLTIQAPTSAGNFQVFMRDISDNTLIAQQAYSAGSVAILAVKIEGTTATLRVNGVEVTNSNGSYSPTTLDSNPDGVLPSIGSFKGLDLGFHGDIYYRVFAGVPHTAMEILDTEVFLADRFSVTMDHDAVVRGELTLPALSISGTVEAEGDTGAAIVGTLTLPPLSISGASTSITNARVHLYVGTDGDDTTGTGAIGAKWLTLEKVRNYLRTQQPLTRHYTIHLDHATGLLPVTDTFELISDDDLQAGREVLLYGGAVDTDIRGGLRGSVQITGWTDTGVNGVWSAPYSGVSPRALFVNNRRRYRVKRGSGLTGSPVRTSTGYTAVGDDILTDPNPDQIELIWNLGASNYNHPRNKVVSVNAGTGAITVNAEAHLYLNFGAGPAPNDHQFLYVQELPNEIENCKSDFDAAVASDGRGLIYHDVANDLIYYKPFAYESMATAKIFAPVVEVLHRAVGVTNPWRVSGCVFEHTDYRMPTGYAERYSGLLYDDAHPLGDWDSQAAFFPPAAVYYEDCYNIFFGEGNRVRHCTSMGAQTVGQCTGEISGNYIRDISGNGLVPGKYDLGLGLSTLVVKNNKIEDVGLEFHGSMAIFGMQQLGSVFQHNWLRRTPYNGITVSFPGNDEVNVGQNLIENVMQHGRDGAGINTGYDQDGLTIEENVVDDTTPANETSLWNMGIYVDEGGTDVVVRRNVFKNVGHSGLFHNLPNPNTVSVTENYSDDPTSVSFLDSGIEPNVFEDFILLDEPAQSEAQDIIDAAGLEEPYLSAFANEELQGDVLGALTLAPMTMAGTLTAEESIGGQIAGDLTFAPLVLSGVVESDSGATATGPLTLAALILEATATAATPSAVAGLRTLPGIDLHYELPLVRGDDYLGTSSRAVFFTEAEHNDQEAWPDLTDATVVITIRIAGTPASVTGTVVSATGTKQLSFDIPGTTIALAGTGVFDVQATLSDGSIATLRSGRAVIFADVTT
jgi:hypothetical protein